jgi:hypothetical protein
MAEIARKCQFLALIASVLQRNGLTWAMAVVGQKRHRPIVCYRGEAVDRPDDGAILSLG